MTLCNPLLWPQQQCHIIDQLYPHSGVNTIGGVVAIEGIVDLPRLHAAIQSAIRQFDALRMWFVMGEGGEVVSQVQPYRWRDIRHLTFAPDSAEQRSRSAASEAFVDKWLSQPFTPLENDLFEFVTFTCGEQHSGYFFKAHHGIADGWSMALLSNHVKRAYEQPDTADDAPPAYSAFLAQQQSYQRSSRFAVDRDWWRCYIDEYRDCFPDNSPIVATEGISCSTWLEPAMINRLYGLCDRYRCTLNTLFIALFALYRARVWGEEKGVLGVPLANRHSREARRCFGMFTNHLSLAYRLTRTVRFSELVAFFQRELERGFKHSKYPIILFNQDLAERGGGQLRAFDYCVNYYNFTYERHISGAAQYVESYYSGAQSYKLQIVLQTVNNHKESLRLSLEALRSAFAPRQLTAIKNGLLDLVTALDAQPDARLGELGVYPAPRIALAGGATRPLFSSLFAAQVAEHGDRTALFDNEQSLTYRQLDEGVEQVAHYLRQLGIGRGQVVGIAAEHSAQTVMAIYGVLRCGAAFLPLNPRLPTARLHAMCCKAQVAHILYDPAMQELAQALAFPATSLSVASTTPVLASEPWSVIEPQDLAYVLFTSGSTGEPKGVQVSHGNLANYLHFAAERYFTAQDRAALYSSLSFDLTITTLFAPLCVGASISVCRHAESEALLRMAVAEQPNSAIKLTPAHLQLLCVAGIGSDRIRTLVVGGEDFKRDLARKAADLFPQAAIYNEYGPTEATVGCMIYRYTGQEAESSLPIGVAIDGCQVAICSPWGCPVPEGEAGELVIYGASVTQGYIDAPQQTAAAYLNDANGVTIGYRSGDIGYVMAPDMLAYQGRDDDQIKINGYRIELREIEQALLSAPQVESVAVAVIDDAQGLHSGLLACVTPSSVDVAAVMQHLRQQLPTYMQPRQCCAIAQLPLSLNGKVDVRQIAAVARSAAPAPGGEPQGDTAIRRAVRACVEGALEQTAFADDENLYVLGLDSIKSIQIAAQLRRHGRTMPAVQVMECGTVNAICVFLANHATAPQSAQHDLNTRIDLPALRWFEQLALPVPDVYNHVIVLQALPGCPIEQLHDRLHALIQQQPALRSALDADGRLRVCDPDACYPNGALTEYPAGQWTLAAVIAQCNSALDVTSGRVFTAALLRAPQPASSRLVLCAHHLCVDMHSWYLILSALDAANTVNGASNSGLLHWNDYLASKTVDVGTHDNWRAVCQTPPPHFPSVSPADDALPRTRAWREDFRHPCVGRLFESRGDTAYSAETYVLTALALALRHYSDEACCRIEMEGMGRGCWPDEPDVADTVGWFTMFYPWVIPLQSDVATLLPAIAADLATRTHGGGDYGLLQMRHAPEGLHAQGVRVNYIGVQAQPPLRHFHIDHLHSDIYTAPENALGCALEWNIARSAADGLSFHCRYDPARIALNDVQLLLTRYKNSLTALDAWLRQHCATPTGTPTLWAL